MDSGLAGAAADSAVIVGAAAGAAAIAGAGAAAGAAATTWVRRGPKGGKGAGSEPWTDRGLLMQRPRHQSVSKVTTPVDHRIDGSWWVNHGIPRTRGYWPRVVTKAASSSRWLPVSRVMRTSSVTSPERWVVRSVDHGS